MKRLGLLFTGVLLLFFYTNCDNSYPAQDKAHSSFVLGDPTDINNFKEVPPAVICGKSGWDFMLRNYVRANCGGCHSSGGVGFPAFTDANLDVAWQGARSVSKDRWAYTTTQNQFCGPTCDLSTTGQIYQGLMQWNDFRSACP